jgi:multiple antibiotic resistance protein
MGIRRYLSDTGTRILVRMMGLLLAALAVQFVLNALAEVGLIRKVG